ncbi:hypothetical protein BGX27_001453 [Mortierella sp. AM989]|nr:hypothetical protein BGX27_001453 [Mortierella sp. AM989]
MFLPWTLFFVNLILVTTRFLLVTAVGAILAIYSRLRGEHANSIRWVRQGGYLEMFSFLVNTRKEITIQAKTALLFAIIGTLAAGFAGRGVVRYIEPTTRQTNFSNETITTKQFVSLSRNDTFSGWSSNIREGTSIVDAMISIASDTKITKVIPDPVIGRVYVPQTSNNYSIGCDNINVSYMQRSDNITLGDKGCARIHYRTFGGFGDLDGAVNITKHSENRWSIYYPLGEPLFVNEMTATTEVNYNNSKCGIVDFPSAVVIAPTDGPSSLPRTLTTKCVSPTGDITSLSMTVVRFMTTTVQQFSDVAKATFDEYDELFQAQEIKLNNSARSNATLFTEVKFEKGIIHSLACNTAPTSPTDSTLYLTCVYVIINAMILEKQAINPDIAKAQGGSFPESPEVTTIMTFYHLPNVNENGSTQILITGLKNANSAAADYFASLGQNLYIDWDQAQVTIMYDTSDAEEGLEIPDWLIICVPIVAAVCAILLGSTEYFLDGRYTSSLYKAIAIPMSTRMNNFAPMLMRSKVGPVEFEDIPVIPSSRRFENDSNNGVENVFETSEDQIMAFPLVGILNTLELTMILQQYLDIAARHGTPAGSLFHLDGSGFGSKDGDGNNQKRGDSGGELHDGIKGLGFGV